jgi:ATP-binding cassette subfamily B protein/subfamily B ATP-binding cassette protein MsbA
MTVNAQVENERSKAELAQIERKAREARIRQLLRDDDELLGKAYDSRLVRRLFGYLTPYKASLILAVILMSISTILSVVGPAIIGFAIDDGIRAGSFEVLRFWTVIFLVSILGEWVTNRARVRIMAFVGTKVVADLRSELFRHLHHLTLNFYSSYSVGRLMSRLIGDVGVLLDFVTWSITGLFRSAFNLIGIVVAMLVLNWQLALVAFSVMPLMFILTNYWRERVRQAYRAPVSALPRVSREKSVTSSTSMILTSHFSTPTWMPLASRRFSSPAWTSSALWRRRWSSAWAAGWCWAMR